MSVLARDVASQRRFDANRLLTPWACFDARVRGVVEAREAVAREDDGAGPALRQALVDLASLCEQCAEEPLAAVRFEFGHQALGGLPEMH